MIEKARDENGCECDKNWERAVRCGGGGVCGVCGVIYEGGGRFRRQSYGKHVRELHVNHSN
jgi:hypothetical protein